MPKGRRLQIADARETIFFGRNGADGCLYQWIDLTIESGHSSRRQAQVTIEAGGEKVRTDLALESGKHTYRAHAKVLWPDIPAEPAAEVVLRGAGETAATTVSVGSHRPWVIYVLADCCSDYTWGVYSDEDACRADDAALSRAEIALSDKTAHLPPEETSAYNFVHARELEYLAEYHPELAEKAFEALRSGRFSVSPFYNNAITSTQSLEELIRQFYFARRLERDHGIPIAYANHQETPTITWIMATVLAECGIPYLAKAIYPFEAPGVERLEGPPVFVWEGPDGSRVLLCRANLGYARAGFLRRDISAAEVTDALRERILSDYRRDGYPFSTAALLGCYADLSPASHRMPAAKAASLRRYRSNDWDYPKMIDGSHERFWKAIEAEIAERGIELPVYRGDYGSAWDVWPVSLAKYFAAWRRGQEMAVTADKIVAVATALDASFHAQHSRKAERAWQCLLSLGDHAWNGANDANRALNARLRKDWSATACLLFGELIEDGLGRIASCIAAPASALMVFNALAWERTSVVEAPCNRPGGFVVRDLETGQAVPAQSAGDGKVLFEARCIPSVGYRLFCIEDGTGKSEGQIPPGGTVVADDGLIDGPLYRVRVSPKTGAIESLYDKRRGRELADTELPYGLGQCVYTVDDEDHVPHSAEISTGSVGPVFGELIASYSVEKLKVKTTVCLYWNIDRIDITHEVERPVRGLPEQLNVVFPFDIPKAQYRFEAPGCIITPGEVAEGGEQLAGSGQAWTMVRHFVDVFNDEAGVTLSQADSAVVMFGHRTQAEDPIAPDSSSAAIWCLAMGNLINHEEVTRDQAGGTSFVFRYSLRGHTSGFDPVAALRFAWEDNNEMLCVRVPEGASGELAGSVRSFLSVRPETVIPTALVVADEGPRAGLVVRLWNLEQAGRSTEAQIDMSGLGGFSSAGRVDLLERDGDELGGSGGAVRLAVRGRGLAAARVKIPER